MAEIKISGLTTLGAVTDTSILPITSAGTTYKVTGSTLTSYLLNKISINTQSASGSGSLDFNSGTGVLTFTPAVSYTLPTSTNSVLGGVKVDASTITIDGNGVISASTTAGNLSGTTLNSTVVNSSLTSVGTLTSLTTSGSLTRSGNISSVAWTTNGVGFKLPAATYTDTSSSGSVSYNYINTIGIPTIASTNVTTVSTAAALYLAGDPVGGTNTTVTASGSYSLYVQGKTNFVGTVRFNGNILSGGGAAMLGFSNTTATAYADLSVSGQTYHPNRTAFRVVGNSSTAWTTSSPTGGVMTSSQWTQDYQQGTALVGSTGIFTAPYAGLYSVTLSARCKDNASPTAQAMIVKTTTGAVTSTVVMVEWAANTTVNHIGAASNVKLAVGDTLKFVVTVGSINFDQNDSWSVTFLG